MFFKSKDRFILLAQACKKGEPLTVRLMEQN